MSLEPKNVLFLCTHNSARSIMAEALLNRHGNGRFRAFSAGSQPSGELNPLVAALLAKMNFKPGDFRSKDWSEFAAPGAPVMNFVFTVCDQTAAETCPVWPGQPMTAHWGFEDPSALQGNDAQKAALVAQIYGQIERRIQIFANLPMATLSNLEIQRQLHAMGRAA
jgi:arsenate reductase (thioredoxin)